MNVDSWLKNSTILLAVGGSHAYGTALPTSDRDFKGIAIPPRPYFYGFVNHFEQAETKTPSRTPLASAPPDDTVIFDIRKFFTLAADCNPNIIEVLWAKPEHYLCLTEAGKYLIQHRDLFLSRKAKHTFSGYALSQLKRIRTHHRWLQKPPTAPPVRSAYGLPERVLVPKEVREFVESQIQKTIDDWNLDLAPLDDAGKIYVRQRVAAWMATVDLNERHAAMRSLGLEDHFMANLDAERRFHQAQVEWGQYQNWLATRNPARAALEAKYRYDTKHAMHLVRLLRMCREILSEGKVLVFRPDAEELLSILHGAWTYEQLVEFAELEDQALAEVERTSPLPKAPDRARLDDLCVEIVEVSLKTTLGFWAVVPQAG
jgi:predicted nucleotidyltransferase